MILHIYLDMNLKILSRDLNHNDQIINDIQLSNEQLEAVDKIKEFLKSSSIAFSLMGSAGTGKTLIMNTLCMQLQKQLPVVLCAPTHKAKLVLSRSTGRDCETLHSLLALTPNLDIFELDFNMLMFKSNDERVCIPSKGLVICDEASMINDDLFNALVLKCKERKTKILFVSDDKQLRPVKSDTKSLVYKVANQFTLNKIFRQSEENALLPILSILRNEPIEFFKDIKGKEGSLKCEYNINSFLKSYIKEIKQAISNEDILATKLTAYTNAKVDAYNKAIKTVLFGNDKDYFKGELLTSCDNIFIKGFNIWNSMDYIINSNPVYTSIYLPYFDDKISGWSFYILDKVTNCSIDIFLLDKETPFITLNKLAYKLEDLRVKAIKAKGSKKQALWGMYFELNNSFATPVDIYLDGRLIKKKSFSGGYACTVHKLQGSTYQSIYVDMKNINTCFDKETKQQLQYVALSRTRTNAVILQ